MSLTIIALILVIGFVLVATEVFLVPGTTVVGVIGLGVIGIGVYYAFKDYGMLVGGGVFLGTALLMGVLTSVGLKRMEKSKFNVKAVIDSKVNEFDYSNINIGDEGVTLTALRPEGNAMINDEKVIVYSKGFYMDSDTIITVVKIKDNKIFVEQKV